MTQFPDIPPELKKLNEDYVKRNPPRDQIDRQMLGKSCLIVVLIIVGLLLLGVGACFVWWNEAVRQMQVNHHL